MKRAVLWVLCLLCSGCSGGVGEARLTPATSVESCRQNLMDVYGAMRAMNAETGWQPTRSGVALFGEVIASGHWPDDQRHRRLLTCPQGVGSQGPRFSFANLDELTSAHSGYAGRDLAVYPLDRFPCGGGEVLMACDNEGRMNHDGQMNVLYADGSVKTFVLDQEIGEGRLPRTAESIPLGPLATDEDLRKLTLD